MWTDIFFIPFLVSWKSLIKYEVDIKRLFFWAKKYSDKNNSSNIYFVYVVCVCYYLMFI